MVHAKGEGTIVFGSQVVPITIIGNYRVLKRSSGEETTKYAATFVFCIH